MCRIAINKLLEQIFSNVLAPTVEAPGLIPGRATWDLCSLGWKWPWSSLFTVVTPTWSVLFDSECANLQVLMSLQLAAALLKPCRCYSAYILVRFMCVEVCSCNTCTAWGSMSQAFCTDCVLICRCSQYLLTSCSNGSFLECWPPTVYKDKQ